MAASPVTSGSDVSLDVNTGVPYAMASNGGSPNPSHSDGNVSAIAPR